MDSTTAGCDHYQRLVQDHRNLSFVLQALETEIDLCASDAWQHPNLALLMDGLDYVHDFPEQFHHPVEESIFDYLYDRKLLSAHFVGSIKEQHESMKKTTQWLSTELIIMLGGQAPSEHFTEVFKQYLWMQQDHIDIENEKVFPLLEDFTQSDWDSIDLSAAVVCDIDPIDADTTDPQRRQYDALLQQIHRDCAISA